MTSQTREEPSGPEFEETNLISSDGEPSSAVLEVDPGGRLGRYVLVCELGRGGMGVVYAAYDAELDRRVAIKLIHTGRTGEARLRREAKALAQLTHPNVVTVYEVGVHNGRVFVAMEYVQGQTLKQWLKAETRSHRDKMDVLIAAAEGLRAAHAMGLVHRDFKPDNVMVGDDGRVRVMDFGLVVMAGTPSEDALAMSENQTVDDQSLTQTGTVMGTPRYMAPEQFMSRPTTPATDQFSFCATALEALGGAHPIGGESYPEIFGRVQRGHRQPEVFKQVPRWIRDVLARGLSVDPQERWASMAELQTRMRQDPRRRRNAYLGVGAVAVVAVAVVGTFKIQGRLKLEACTQGADEVPGGWYDGSRTATEAGLSAVAPLGESTAQRVVPKLDEYVSLWREVAVEVCFEPGWDDPQLDQQASSCLADSRRRFDGLVDSFSSDPAPTVVRAAVRATSDLPDPSRCRNRVWLRRQPALPMHQLAEVEAIEELLSSAALLASLVRYAEAQVETEAARERAEALQWPPLMARADLKLGEVYARQGNAEVAQRLTQRGRILALTSGDTDAAIRAAAAELRMLANLDRGDDAVALRDAFEPVVARYAQPGTRSHLAWILAQGELAVNQFQFEEAETLLSQAQESAASVLGEEHPLHARVWLLLASLAERRQLPELADERVARALELGRAVFGPEHPTVSAMRNVSAMVRFDQGQTEQGLQILEELAETSTRVLGPEHPDTLDYVSNLATREAMAGKLDQARTRMEYVLEVERRLSPQSSGVATALTNLGTLTIDQGRFDEGIAQLEESLKLHEATTGRRTLRVANTQMNLGSFLSERGEYQRAVPHLRDALALFEDLLDSEARPVAHIVADLALIESRTGQARDANDRLQRGRALLERHLPPDSTLLALLDSHLGVSRMQQGDLSAGEALIDAAGPKLDTQDVAPRTRADFLINRARVSSAAGNATEARSDLARARELADAVEDAPRIAEMLRRRIDAAGRATSSGSTSSADSP